MNFDSESFTERIRFHYENLTDIEEFMDVKRTNSPNFQPLLYFADVKDNAILEKKDLLEDMAKDIGRHLANHEFASFLFELKKIPCETIKTNLDNVVETLEKTHDELWDLGLGPDQLFMPLVLKNEIRKRKQSTGIGIDFSTQNLKPTLAKELGNSQIIFCNKDCFGKTYPESMAEQILVSVRIGMRESKIECKIIQNLHFRNLESMRKIIVIDAEKSDFLNPDN